MIYTFLFSLLISMVSITEIGMEPKLVKDYIVIEETVAFTVNPCIGNIDSEMLKEAFESENPKMVTLIQYYMWPASFCFNDCYGDSPLCCQIVIIVE